MTQRFFPALVTEESLFFNYILTAQDRGSKIRETRIDNKRMINFISQV